MDLRSFADVLSSRQGGIHLKPGKPYRRVLKRQQVIEIFGEVPEYSVYYDLRISINKLDNESYEVVVTRMKG